MKLLKQQKQTLNHENIRTRASATNYAHLMFCIIEFDVNTKQTSYPPNQKLYKHMVLEGKQ